MHPFLPSVAMFAHETEPKLPNKSRPLPKSENIQDPLVTIIEGVLQSCICLSTLSVQN